MRQLQIRVPRGDGPRVLEVSEELDGRNFVQIPASEGDDEYDLVIMQIENHCVDEALEQLGDLNDVHTTLIPTGVVTLEPTDTGQPKEFENVQNISPISVYLHGLETIGSLSGFLALAVFAGVVAWVGLYTDTSYLLVASMLISPFAGPAMNASLAAARGDIHLLGTAIARYIGSIAAAIAPAAAISLVIDQTKITPLMRDMTEAQPAMILLPIAAGLAGATYLVQAERSSLVSSAGVGMLVAASLAPPTGMLGMAIFMQDWEPIQGMLVILAMQLTGIHAVASVLFRIYGLEPGNPHFEVGRKWVFPISLVISLGLFVLLIYIRYGDKLL